MADVLIAGKSDLASEEEIEHFRSWASGLYPPKLMIDIVAMGEIDLSLLDLQPDQERPPLHPHAHSDSRLDAPAIASPLPGRPVKLSNRGAGYQGCGWIFSADDILKKDELLDMLGPPNIKGVERLKGVFHVGKDWLLINRVGSEVTVSSIAYRRDSRLEVIVADDVDVDWRAIETALIECLL